MFMATLLHEKPKGGKLFQILFFIPYICSTVAVSLMWRWILDWDGGILNSILGTNIKWLEDPNTITWCIIVSILWQAPGYGIVMYKAAFSNINNDLYEAAALDGANAWQKFKTVTLPGVAPTTFFLLQAGVVAGLLTYDLAALIIPNAWGVPGGNESMGLTLIRLVHFLIQNSTTTDMNGISYMVSCACVISWLIFLVTGVLSMILFRQREKSAQ
jgi:multiple sugar transport system permease protein